MGQRPIEDESPESKKLKANGASFRKNASRALKMARAMPDVLAQNAELPYLSLQEDVKEQLTRELHTYPRKNQVVARVIWFVLGIVGGHRFYLGHMGTGLAMLCTLGGGLVWWIVDGFKLKSMVTAFNENQAERERTGQPPVDMDFVPVVSPEVLTNLPAWSKGQSSKVSLWGEVLFDAVTLAFFSFLLGTFTESTGYRTGAYAIGALLIMVNFADLLIPFHTSPVIRAMIHWDYRLRLFYHFNAPARRLALYFRPLVGLFYAPFKKKARTEVLLYLEIGSIFFGIKVLLSLMGGELWTQIWSIDFEGFIGSWVEDVIMGFLTMYGFAAPIGAILMKHILLRRPNAIRWGLSILIVFFAVSGLLNG